MAQRSRVTLFLSLPVVTNSAAQKAFGEILNQILNHISRELPEGGAAGSSCVCW